MSLPSDVTPDIPPAQPPIPGAANRLNAQQVGLAAAALVAFLGITYLGPAITRMTRKPSRRDRMRGAARQTRRDAERAGRVAKARIRELGGRSRRFF